MRRPLCSIVFMSMTCLSACGAEVVQTAPQHAPIAPADPAASPGVHLHAGEPVDPKRPDGPITAALRAETIDRLLRLLSEKYVFPDRAAAVKKAVTARVQRGDYSKIETGNALAKALTDHVNEILHDAHFRVRFSLATIPMDELTGKVPSSEEIKRYEAEARWENGGFEKVERLPGNIGYLDVRSFGYLDTGIEAAAAAMNFLANTDALIIDLRSNGGGEPEMVAVLCSYLFGKSVHLNDLYFRPDNETRQYWTLPSVPGKRYLDRDVYVLTSKKTGSGAEEFAYNLKNLKRATLVGESTWGGANPGDVLRLSEHFSAFIPSGRAINPITKTNWEGVGVEPDIKVAEADALRVAQIKALEKIIPSTKAPELKQTREARLRELNPK